MNTISASAYKGDIVQRLRNWRGLHLAHGGQLFEEAADEIERLRESADRRGEIAVNRRREIERLRLTDAEREAVESTIVDLDGGANWNEQRFWPTLAGKLRERSATLRGLLARTGDCPAPDNAADRNNGTTDSE